MEFGMTELLTYLVPAYNGSKNWAVIIAAYQEIATMEQRPIRKNSENTQVSDSFNGCNSFKLRTSVHLIQSGCERNTNTDSVLISASILPPKINRNPPVTVNFIFPSSSLNPMFVHFKPSSASTEAMNPRRMEAIIKARHAWTWTKTEKEKTNQGLYRN